MNLNSWLLIDTQKRYSIRNSQEFGDYLPDSALLVLNDTKVIPARLIGNKRETGGKIELLLVQETEKDVWEVLAKPMRNLKVGTQWF